VSKALDSASAEVFKNKKEKSFPSVMDHRAALMSVSCSPQPDTGRSRETDTGLVHGVACPFTTELIN